MTAFGWIGAIKSIPEGLGFKSAKRKFFNTLAVILNEKH